MRRDLLPSNPPLHAMAQVLVRFEAKWQVRWTIEFGVPVLDLSYVIDEIVR